jgi:hypothetical protein
MARLEELVEQEEVRPEHGRAAAWPVHVPPESLQARFDHADDGTIEEQSLAYQRVRRELLDAERSAVVALRNEGRIADDVMQRVTRDLDLEDSRLDV